MLPPIHVTVFLEPKLRSELLFRVCSCYQTTSPILSVKLNVLIVGRENAMINVKHTVERGYLYLRNNTDVYAKGNGEGG